MFLWVFKNNFIAASLESIYVGDDVELQHGMGKVIEINYDKKIAFAEMSNPQINDCIYCLKWIKKIGWHCEERVSKKDFLSEI